jgi:hypothetical protein
MTKYLLNRNVYNEVDFMSFRKQSRAKNYFST